MTGELRCRSLSETLSLAVLAAKKARVTRVSDITAFAVPGVPVFQATRPSARSLSVSQGKGLTATAAIVGALLETAELWSAENLAEPEVRRSLAQMTDGDIAVWSGPRDALAIDLDPVPARGWVKGNDLLSGRQCSIPWDLLCLDCTVDTSGCRATSVGLACGNTRTESLVSGLAETLEHHSMVLFDRLAPHERLARQIALATIDDPAIRRLLHLTATAGFQVKAWSMANDAGFPAILCTLFQNEFCFDDISPPGGSGCHPKASVAFVRALLEAVQSRAALVAGARDDLRFEEYEGGCEREASIVFGALAFGDGLLNWRDVPTTDCPTSEHCVDFLLARAEALSSLPIMAFDHEPPSAGLHLAHVLAPGLLVGERRHDTNESNAPVHKASKKISCLNTRGHAAKRTSGRKVLFAGPSIAGLDIPPDIETRGPARCGDLAALLVDPPAAVGLIDGVFKSAPTVWHKEIMSLVAYGTRVIGGASLGAMRAAELESYGMEGVGTIFHAYRSGLLVRDDAVMLVHAPREFGYAPLSLPLVDAEHALLCANLPAAVRRMMQRIVRCAPFETRTWQRSIEEYRLRTGAEFPLSAETLAATPSLKRIDAKLVIELLASENSTGAPAKRWPMPPLTNDFRSLLSKNASAFGASLP